MDVNQVRFGSYSIGSNLSPSKQQYEEKTQGETNARNAAPNTPVKAENMLDAMNLAGVQNRAQISIQQDRSIINPSEYLDESRIADIEAMMAGFETGVGQAAAMIESEFPNTFTAQQKLALAAEAFARS